MHGGDKGDFEGFGLSPLSVIDGFHDRVFLDGSDRSHVEGRADFVASAPDRALAAHHARVAIERRNADKGGGLSLVHKGQFGEIADQRP